MAEQGALLKNLSENRKSVWRFHNFKIPAQLQLFVHNPFTIAVTGSCPAEAKNVVPAINKGAFCICIWPRYSGQ